MKNILSEPGMTGMEGGGAAAMPPAAGPEVCVPASAFAMSGETGEAIAPEPGETVTGEVEFTVARSEGGNLYLTPKTVNGQPVGMEPDADDAVADGTPEAINRLRPAMDEGM